MTLSDWLIIISLGCTVYGVGRWAWVHYAPVEWPKLPTWSRVAVAPAPAAPPSAPPPLPARRSKRRSTAFNSRSGVQRVQNAANPRSAHQDAVEPAVNVQPNVHANIQNEPATPPPAPDGALTLTPVELVQLAEALRLRQEGATVEECMSKAFGVKKGGSASYQRAKQLYDAATVMPGAAPDGSYVAPTPPKRKRRVAR